MERILYFDSLSGISGDMTIGALLDLGVDEDEFLEELKKINIDGYEIKVEEDKKKGITGINFDVILADHDTHSQDNHNHHHAHRNLYDIEKIIDESELNEDVKELSRRIFKLVAQAEAVVHAKPIDKVHFHEVGAVDSIVDIIGAAICIDKLGVDKIYSSPLHVGTGFTKCAHGKIPVPAPATLEILKDVPIYSKGIKSELVTPTGAAIIKTLAQDFTTFPQMSVEKIGYGLGNKDLEIANLLRVVLGKKKRKRKLMIIETNIDDMNPEVYSHLVPLLLKEGALDVYLTNIMMKKNRPGVKVNILCYQNEYQKFEDILFRETTTLGTRRYEVEGTALDRKFIKVETEFGEMTLKVALTDGEVLKYAPEYDECKEIANEFGLPLKDVYNEVLSKVDKIME
ncbi:MULTISPECIES: nickel pincer cofactor biosynthesis protein LarC [unclassified Candidatus Frackibacter]|uniref:nickel pincer cofactor biosynthesis protein LarC n=1 Tax=unclassified Candidatus Frackibacter TaxID=2648818 RepID=UPI000880E6B1|nr:MULTISPECIES: nickel pincer cofactor biosynthesis protein LarC [unclassified Candidatus Frackibacter]SDC47222.1 hypothetical protein SAMN04515661_11124 [Candidatus Frackibacter sp. WG11]SEM81411.1 hypothetical protein SAMN04488698_11826 [Candidatus Frackibacter sp. WG12]SFL72613.1 hypothetical protein SAMN04488699_11124 [Candidatus Frackibacter sp. WG13]